MGQMEVIVAPCKQLFEAFELTTSVKDMDELKLAFSCKKTEQVKELTAKGVPIKMGKVEKDTLLYVPSGWMIAERSTSGPLVYGIRKSVFVQTADAVDQYASCIKLLGASGTSTDKMDKIQSLLKA
jgi:hypothetical protein